MKAIGMIVPTVDNSFFSGLVKRAERCLRTSGYQLLVMSSDNDAENEKNAYGVLQELQVEGILSVSGLSVFPKDLVREDMPLVWLDRVPESERKIPWVSNDDENAMELATDALIEKGCNDILLMPGYLAEGQESPRVKGYRSALEKHNLPYREEYVLNRRGEASSEAETEELVRNHLHNGNKVDGIITSSDRAAFGAMAALRSVGYYVPEDVKLISFDNSPYSTMVTPAVTALDRNAEALAEKACELLLKQICKDPDDTIENTIPVSLVRRDSIR